MGTTRRKGAKALPQIHGRTTRSRGKALGDPTENTHLLEQQLRSLGLYAASTLGDGNCLFRALSDQLYGSDTFHLKLRADVCNWIEDHKDRYEPFVDDERGLAVHLQCMRQQGTYGGHLELSAFAHMARRNVKVIQPGLVYVIEWDAGGDIEREPQDSPSPAPYTAEDDDQEKPLTRRERKRLEKERLVASPPVPQPSDGRPLCPVYVAYHIYEHYSSIRNLRGPHSGLPNIQESSAVDDDDDADAAAPVSSLIMKPGFSRSVAAAKQKGKAGPRRTRAAGSHVQEAVIVPLTPSQIPLPMSRSPSPVRDELPALQSPIPYPLPATPPSPARIYRSPKRTFDESSASSEGSQSMPKRAKSSKPVLATSRLNPDFDIDTPSLTMSTPGSPSSMSELSSLSSSSRESTPPLAAERQASPLTQRQRKKLGLPKQRRAVVAGTKASAGKIRIPGGKCHRAGVGPSKLASEASEEWQLNGAGRLDVRGFKELKI